MNHKKSDDQTIFFELDNPEKSFEEGLQHYFDRNYKLAADCLLRAQQSGVGGPDIDTTLGFVYLAMDKMELAEASFKDVLSRYPAEEDARLGLGEVHYLNGNAMKAEDCFRAVLSINQQNARAWCNLGVIYHRLNNYERAKIYYETAIEFGSKESRFHLGTILMDDEELEKAEEILTPLLDSAEYRSEAMLNIGYILLQLGKFDESLRKVTEAEKLMHDELKLNYSAGLAQFYNGRFYRALTHFEKAIKINPKYFPAENALQTCRSRIAMIENEGYDYEDIAVIDGKEHSRFTHPDDSSLSDKNFNTVTGSPMVSLIINTSENNLDLENCLNKCLLQTYSKYEIIILPDRPIENSRRSIKVHPTGRVNGSMKRNIGSKIASGSILIFIETDARPSKNWMNQTVQSFVSSNLESAGLGYPFPCFITRRNELTSLSKHTIQTDSINEFLRHLSRSLPKVNAVSYMMSPLFSLSTSNSFSFLARFFEMQVIKIEDGLTVRIILKLSKQTIPIYQVKSLLDPGMGDVKMSY